MKAGSDWTNASRWRALIELGDRLLEQQSHGSQISLIRDSFSEITGAQVDAWLIGEYEPLPHENAAGHISAGEKLDYIGSGGIVERLSIQNRDDCVQIELPLQNVRETVGMMVLEFQPGTEISPACEDFLLGASQYFANILDLSRLASLKDWRLDQLTLVRSVNSAIMQFSDPVELFPRIVELIQTTFHFFFVAIYTVDPSRQRIVLRSSAGRQLDEKQISELCPLDGIRFGEGLVGACALSGKEIHLKDISEDERYRSVDGLQAARSEICLPLIMGNQVLGVLEILSDRTSSFHENDILVLRILSDNVALAVRNTGLFNDLLEQTWVSTLLLQVTEAAQQHANVDDLLGAVVRTIPLLIGVQRCAIYIRDSQTGEYLLNAHYGFDAMAEALLAMLPYSDEGRKLFLETAAQKKPLSIPKELVEPSAAAGKKENGCCGLIPMAAHSIVYGIMLVDNLDNQTSTQAGLGIPREEVFMAVGRQTALAVENMRLQESQENEAYVTAVLLQVAEMVAAAVDIHESIESIINLLPLVVGVDTVLVYLLDAEKKRFYQQARLSYQWKSQLSRLPQSIRFTPYGNLAALMTAQKPFYFHQGTDSIEHWLQVQPKRGLDESLIFGLTDNLMMVFPLFIMGEQYGLMFIGESEDGYKYREKKIEIISGIARNLSLAIQNERLKKEMISQESIRREIELAREIQTTFLPETLPEIAGWEFSAHWRPALQVGGDFYDVFTLGEGLVGLVIADVSDKGMPAALYMTVARTLIRAEALKSSQPAETLQRINRLLLMNSQKGLFVTCIFAILDTTSAMLTYSNAGHNPPLWLKKTRPELVWLEKGGMPLGVSEELILDDHTLHLGAGDLLMFYTDGVTEAQSADGSFFGEDRLFNLLKQFRSKTSFPLIDILDMKIMEFRGDAPVSDDLTLLIVQRAAG